MENEPLQRLVLEKERLHEYANWAKKQLSQKTAREYTNALKKLLSGSVFTVEKDKLSKNQRLALRSFAKFLLHKNAITDDEYEAIKNTIELKKSDIDTRFYTDDDIREILLGLKNKKHKLYIRLLAESGLRRSHAIEAWNKIVAGDYKTINNDIAVTQLDIRRGTKRAFVCFCSVTLAEEIRRLGERMTKSAAENLAKRRKIRYNAIRKWWYTKAIGAGMDALVADFLQGRMPATVAAKHYLDAYALATRQYKQVLLRLREVTMVVPE